MDVYREEAQDLADRGYLVYVPNLFSGGVIKYCIRAMVSKAGRVNSANSEVNQEIHMLLDVLKTDPRSNGRLGMLGQCLTGGYVIQMAKREDMLAPVIYHHAMGIEGTAVVRDTSYDTVSGYTSDGTKQQLSGLNDPASQTALQVSEQLQRTKDGVGFLASVVLGAGGIAKTTKIDGKDVEVSAAEIG